MITFEQLNNRSSVNLEVKGMKRCTQGIDIVPMELEKAMKIAELLKVFGDPGRIRILSLLAEQEVCVTHIAQALDMSVSAVSHQLSLMRRQKIVRYIKDGKNTYYTLDDGHVADVLMSGIEHTQHS